MNRNLPFVILLALIAAAGCRPAVESREAIRLAVIEDLKGRSGIDPARTTVRVVKVTYIKDRAEADVAFHTKGGNPEALDVHYSLSREGKGWKVESRLPFAGRSGRRPNENPDGVDPGPTPPGSVDPPR
jgi:hypothetical protein